MTQSISRRNFLGAALAGTAGVVAGGMLAGCAPGTSGTSGTNDDNSQQIASSQVPVSWDEEADIVVVGGGGTGYSAAVSAGEEGASVIVLEKNNIPGGDACLCAGILGGGGSRAQAERGITSDADMVFQWFMDNPEWYGPKDPTVARALADASAPTLDWLQDMGIEFSHVGPYYGYTDYPVIHIVDGGGGKMMQTLMDRAEELGVRTHLEHRVTKIIGDETGRAIGVIATDKSGKPVSVHATKAVIVATGDATGSTPMMGVLNYECRNVLPGSMPTCEGDGIKLMQEFGVMTTRISDIPHLSTLAGVQSGTMINVNYTEGEDLLGIWVDQSGSRFFNEKLSYNNPFGHRAVMRKQNEQDGIPPFMVVGTTPTLTAIQESRGFAWVQGETIEELASLVGIDPAGLKATVDAYNAACEAGEDKDFERDPATMVPLTGPFYAGEMLVSSSTGMGGAKIDGGGHALKMREYVAGEDALEPVPGLYAGGCACEWNSAQGCSAFAGIIMGRIAAKNAVKENPSAT